MNGSHLTRLKVVVVVVVTTLALLAGGLSTAGARPVENDADSAPVDDEVRTELAASGEAGVWVRFGAKADLTEAAATEGWGERGEAVVAALRRQADLSQAGVRKLLRSRGVAHESFWAVNTVKVRAGADLVDQLARQPGVVRIETDRTVEWPDRLRLSARIHWRSARCRCRPERRIGSPHNDAVDRPVCHSPGRGRA